MRQFILENQPVKNGIIVLEGKDYKYLRQVLRVKVGDMLNVRLQSGELKSSTVTTIDDKIKKIGLQFCDLETDEAKSITRGVQADEINLEKSKIQYVLFQFLPKPQKFEMIVRQATECGISYIVPIIGDYTEKSSVYALEGNKKERLERIVKEARQQSGSPVDTKILAAQNLEQAIDFWNEFKDQSENLGLVLSERKDGDESLFQLLRRKKALSKVCVAVGSEGGISPEEVDLLKKKGLFQALHFDVNILRCETAALYGIASVQSAITELEKEGI